VKKTQTWRPGEPAPQKIFDSGDAHWWDGGEKVQIGPSFNPRKLDTTLG
jgi:hypothetical protein